MAWGASNSTSFGTVNNTEEFSSDITLNPGELSHHQIDFDPNTSPTDDLQVSVYGTLDDTSEEWDTTPFLRFIMENSPDPHLRGFTVSQLYKYRVGVVATGGTDTFTNVTMRWRLNGIDV